MEEAWLSNFVLEEVALSLVKLNEYVRATVHGGRQKQAAALTLLRLERRVERAADVTPTGSRETNHCVILLRRALTFQPWEAPSA